MRPFAPQLLAILVSLTPVFSMPCFAISPTCKELLGENLSRRDLEALSDYSRSARSSGDDEAPVTYFFSKGAPLGFCRGSECHFFKARSKAAMNFASHAEILKRQNPNRDFVTDPEEMMRVAAENLPGPRSNGNRTEAKLDASASPAEVARLMRKNFASLENHFSEEDYYLDGIFDSTDTVKNAMEFLGQDKLELKFLWVIGSQGDHLGLYFQPGTLIHYQITLALLGPELGHNAKFIEKFIRGGKVVVHKSAGDKLSYYVEEWEAVLPSIYGGSGALEMSPQERDAFEAELAKFLSAGRR